MISNFCHDFFSLLEFRVKVAEGERSAGIIWYCGPCCRYTVLSKISSHGCANENLCIRLLSTAGRHRSIGELDGRGGSCSSTTTTAPWRDKSRLENRCNAAEEICRERPDSSPAVEANLDRCRGSSCASMHVLCSQLLSRDCDESPCFMFNLSILTCRMHMQM